MKGEDALRDQESAPSWLLQSNRGYFKPIACMALML